MEGVKGGIQKDRKGKKLDMHNWTIAIANTYTS